MDNKKITQKTLLPKWYKLDNAANFYPAIMQRNWNSVYRVSVTMNDEIRPDALKQAIADLKPRFPTFYVQLRKGFFWYNLEPVENLKIVEEEKKLPCRPFQVGVGNKPLFRVLYYRKRISLEFFHSVTDGYGAVVFLKTLLHRYLTLCGHEIGRCEGVSDFRDDPVPEEIEDSFIKHYEKVKKIKRTEPTAYRFRPRRTEDFFSILTATFPVEKLKQTAKTKGVTLTQYLTAVYILSFANSSIPPKNLPVRISVPINLRNLFPSTSLRNFSLYANVGLAVNKETTIDEVLESIKPQLEYGFSKERLLLAFCRNVRDEVSPINRPFPLFLKNMVINTINTLYGETRFTSALSNMGRAEFPPEIEKHISEVLFSLGPAPASTINATVATFREKMTVCFSSVHPDVSVQSYFIKHLTDLGINVEAESNV